LANELKAELIFKARLDNKIALLFTLAEISAVGHYGAELACRLDQVLVLSRLELNGQLEILAAAHVAIDVQVACLRRNNSGCFLCLVLTALREGRKHSRHLLNVGVQGVGYDDWGWAWFGCWDWIDWGDNWIDWCD